MDAFKRQIDNLVGVEMKNAAEMGGTAENVESKLIVFQSHHQWALFMRRKQREKMRPDS